MFQNKMPEQTIMLIILQHLKTDVACSLILVNERILFDLNGRMKTAIESKNVRIKKK